MYFIIKQQNYKYNYTLYNYTLYKHITWYSTSDDYLLESEKINSFVLGTRLIPFTQFNIKDGSQHGGFSDVTPGHNKQQN